MGILRVSGRQKRGERVLEALEGILRNTRIKAHGRLISRITSTIAGVQIWVEIKILLIKSDWESGNFVSPCVKPIFTSVGIIVVHGSSLPS